MTRQSNDLRKEITEMINERLDQGCDLIARGFETAALDAVIDTCPKLVGDWLNRVSRDAPRADYLLVACRGFYEALCQVLLNVRPKDGVALFRRLDACPAFRLIDRTTEIENLRFALFQARPSALVCALRAELFERCINDWELFELTFVAQFHGAHEWLDEQISRWLGSSLPFDRARSNERDSLKLHERLVGEKVLEEKAWPWMGRFLPNYQGA